MHIDQLPNGRSRTSATHGISITPNLAAAPPRPHPPLLGSVTSLLPCARVALPVLSGRAGGDVPAISGGAGNRRRHRRQLADAVTTFAVRHRVVPPHAQQAAERDGGGPRKLRRDKTLVKQGWGADNPAFRQIFTSLSDATMQPCENPTEFLREGLGIKNGSPWHGPPALHVGKEYCKQADHR